MVSEDVRGRKTFKNGGLNIFINWYFAENLKVFVKNMKNLFPPFFALKPKFQFLTYSGPWMRANCWEPEFFVIWIHLLDFVTGWRAQNFDYFHQLIHPFKKCILLGHGHGFESG
jgi:hypothetical protein